MEKDRTNIIKTLILGAINAGFTTAVELKLDTLNSRIEVRDMCEANTCGKYSKNWACPPGCGPIEECEAKIKSYQNGILVQFVGEIEDSYDIEGIMEVQENYNRIFRDFTPEVRAVFSDCLALGAGCCTVCKECTYPDGEPCRFPERSFSSMESFGLFVSEICTANGVAYNYGPEKMAFTGCYLF